MFEGLKEYIDYKSIKQKTLYIADKLIDCYMEGETVNFVIIMNGAVYFGTKLVKYIQEHEKLNIRIFFVYVNTYKGTKSSKEPVPINLFDIHPKYFENSNIVIIDDILDTGKTMNCVYDMFKQCKPLSIQTVCLLSKNLSDFKLDFVGFHIKNVFVVGYGLDYNNKYRQLQSIYELQI